jgi:hypothetical protein
MLAGYALSMPEKSNGFAHAQWREGLFKKAYDLQDVLIEYYAEGKQNDWQPIETVPKGQTVLVFYKNAYGTGKIIRAKFVERFTLEDASGDDNGSEYSEENDCYYCPAGWYEQIEHWDDYGSIRFYDKPTHWMLPEPPKEESK